MTSRHYQLRLPVTFQYRIQMETLKIDKSHGEAFARVKNGARKIGRLAPAVIDHVLEELVRSIVKHSSLILSANKTDLKAMDAGDPKYDRLLLTEARIKNMAEDVRNVSRLASPTGEILLQKSLANGLELSKVTIPLGVIGFIYEARPNVTIDVFALCLKSGNGCILKGGSDAYSSNLALLKIIADTLEASGIDPSCVLLLPPGRSETLSLLNATDYVDAIIPRGGRELIDFVKLNARVPVILTGAGVVHLYFDKDGDLELGRDVIHNAKTRKVSACNSLDTLLVHRKRLNELPELLEKLIPEQVRIYAPEMVLKMIEGHYPGELLFEIAPNGYETEHLSYALSIGTVDSPEQAVDHINMFSARNSEAIITGDPETARFFQQNVDAAVVYVNASTAFTDGAQFGLGAEIGISTQKLHASGPMGLQEMVCL